MSEKVAGEKRKREELDEEEERVKEEAEFENVCEFFFNRKTVYQGISLSREGFGISRQIENLSTS